MPSTTAAGETITARQLSGKRELVTHPTAVSQSFRCELLQRSFAHRLHALSQGGRYAMKLFVISDEYSFGSRQVGFKRLNARQLLNVMQVSARANLCKSAVIDHICGWTCRDDGALRLHGPSFPAINREHMHPILLPFRQETRPRSQPVVQHRNGKRQGDARLRVPPLAR